jgi:hypothetical protein
MEAKVKDPIMEVKKKDQIMEEEKKLIGLKLSNEVPLSCLANLGKF